MDWHHWLRFISREALIAGFVSVLFLGMWKILMMCFDRNHLFRRQMPNEEEYEEFERQAFVSNSRQLVISREPRAANRLLKKIINKPSITLDNTIEIGENRAEDENHSDSEYETMDDVSIER